MLTLRVFNAKCETLIAIEQLKPIRSGIKLPRILFKINKFINKEKQAKQKHMKTKGA